MYLEVEGSTSAGYAPVLEGFDRVYSFLYSRVGNRFDAEDLTQQVAVKALPRLHAGAPPESVRAYLYSTAKSVLAVFWSDRLRMPQSELPYDLADRPADHSSSEPSADSAAWLDRTLAALPPHYRQVLELRFLQGRSIKEAAREMGRTEGALKVMQLRALRAAAQAPSNPPSSLGTIRPPRPGSRSQEVQTVSGR